MTPAGRRITGFHAHVYFDASTLTQARRLCEDAARLFALQVGQVHERPVGPHPDWSCQLSFALEAFGAVIPWLALHRDGLIVFVHPLSGNEVLDHRDHAMWMGAIRPLDLSVLSDREQRIAGAQAASMRTHFMRPEAPLLIETHDLRHSK